MRVLVAEDEKSLNALIEKKLKAEHYAVDTVDNGEDALSYLTSTTYDIVILDIMMPKKSGFEVLSEYRAEGGKAPVLFLTALGSVDKRIEGLDKGADDYLVKPFEFDELLARMRALLRRRDKEQSDNILRVANLTLDRAKHIVKREGKEINLSSREFSILEYMMINEGIVLSRDAILSHTSDFGYEGESNVVDVYIRYLRKKVDDNYDKKLIHTVRGSGYVLKDESK